jgi:hypothetical protein
MVGEIRIEPLGKKGQVLIGKFHQKSAAWLAFAMRSIRPDNFIQK